jgi:hypothetical protein
MRYVRLEQACCSWSRYPLPDYCGPWGMNSGTSRAMSGGSSHCPPSLTYARRARMGIAIAPVAAGSRAGAVCTRRCAAQACAGVSTGGAGAPCVGSCAGREAASQPRECLRLVLGAPERRPLRLPDRERRAGELEPRHGCSNASAHSTPPFIFAHTGLCRGIEAEA